MILRALLDLWEVRKTDKWFGEMLSIFFSFFMDFFYPSLKELNSMNKKTKKIIEDLTKSHISFSSFCASLESEFGNFTKSFEIYQRNWHPLIELLTWIMSLWTWIYQFKIPRSTKPRGTCLVINVFCVESSFIYLYLIVLFLLCPLFVMRN